MRATNIRTKSNEIPSTDTILRLEKLLKSKMHKLGFISNATPLTRSSMKIGLHMCSFRIDTRVHGYNADIGYIGSRCKAGYKRTSIPTWKQREDFNHMVNDCFDRLGLSARIMSGNFKIRDAKEGRVNEWSPMDGYGGGERLFEIRELEI